MSFTDTIKNGVLSSYQGTVSFTQILFALLASFAAGILILLIYKVTSESPVTNKSFFLTIVMTSMISAMIVTTITSNLALSLGMVGALSIVRFRTAIKNPLDTVYMFWSVAAGITAGAQAYLLCIFSCLVIGLVVFLFCRFTDAGAGAYVLVIRTDSKEALFEVKRTVKHSLKKASISSESYNKYGAECVFEVPGEKGLDNKVTEISSLAGVTEVTLTQCSSTAI